MVLPEDVQAVAPWVLRHRLRHTGDLREMHHEELQELMSRNTYPLRNAPMFARTSVLKSVSSFPRPTRQGWFYLLALLGIVIGAINYGNNLGLLLSFIFAGACAASLLQTWSLTRSLTVRFTGAAPVFAGEEAGFGFILTAPAAGHSLKAGFPGGPIAEYALQDSQSSSLVLSAVSQKRGLFRPGPLQVRTSYPLGIFEMRLLLENKAECLVYPKPYDGVLQLPEGGLGEGEGEATGPGVDDFGGLRPYVPGDPAASVWPGKVSSRGHGLQTKEFHALSGHSPLLDWDGLPEADQETRLEMLCRMLLQAEENGQPFGLRLPASEIPSGSGKQHLHRCLRELALFRPA